MLVKRPKVSGVYILQNTMARGVGKLCWGKNENWGSEEQNEKEGKRGKEKEEKVKGDLNKPCRLVENSQMV